MGRYTGFGVGAAAASPGRTIAQLLGGTGVRAEIDEIILSSADTPADLAFLWKVMRCTTAGTATAFTPTLVDPTDPKAATATFNANASAEPTVTANSEVLDLSMYHRATIRWVAPEAGKGYRTPATANNGIVARAQHASSVLNMRAFIGWTE